jgi:hypothetical protein
MMATSSCCVSRGCAGCGGCCGSQTRGG